MEHPVVTLSYDPVSGRGLYSHASDIPMTVWIRIRQQAQRMLGSGVQYGERSLSMPWPSCLNLLRTMSSLQVKLGFRFVTDSSSEERVKQFLDNFRSVARQDSATQEFSSTAGIDQALSNVGWDHEKRQLRSYQSANLNQLIRLANGANFSVPGAGKTTVSFALHLLLQDKVDFLIVVGPASAYPAWKSVMSECLRENAPTHIRAPFCHLTGGKNKIEKLLQTNHRRFFITYEQLVKVDQIIAQFLSTNATHLILDESHRMKEGYLVKRGRMLMDMAHLAKRRDILSGTPMPQSASDMQSQLDFLWPGVGLGARIDRGEAPRFVLGNLYVRTTKSDLGLPDRILNFVNVPMHREHLALYLVLCNEVRSRASNLRRGNAGLHLASARKSVMRVLQAATVPEVLINAFGSGEPQNISLLQAAIDAGPSLRILHAVEMARELAKKGEKVLIWTIFTAAVETLLVLLRDLNPAVLYGKNGQRPDTDPQSKEGNLNKFKNDPSCWVMVANPAAAAEGISLHMHCHHAIYVDRSYNATHYLQSIDRIHRLGLLPGTETHIYILRNLLPAFEPSIDTAVARRLETKISNLQRLLDDEDLHQLSLDEQSAPSAVDKDIDPLDIDDLIKEIESAERQKKEQRTKIS
nr:DEAD/DEAH box helicase [uncultured Duganella sp.]